MTKVTFACLNCLQKKNHYAILVSAMQLSAHSDFSAIRTTAYRCLLSLATDEGINASGRDEIYGCIFGRDSAVTILKILRVLSTSASSDINKETLTDICKRALLTLIKLQGRTFNMESGEEPGKFIHEYRKDKFDHLVKKAKPWFIYPDGKLRNYDSLDATPLILIAIYRYYQLIQDGNFLIKALPSVEKGLNWIISYADRDNDFLVEYEFPKERQHGGLLVQSWTDSHESVRKADGSMPIYPIAPVEVQGYTWLALNLWADFHANTDINYSNSRIFAQRLKSHAKRMKKRFNAAFLFKDNKKLHFPSQALDGNKEQIRTITGNPLLLLWASYKTGGKVESILEDSYISDLVKRAFLPDMFDLSAGIRTMSTESPTFNPNANSYHNGSYWPKLNGMAHEGLQEFGYSKEAEKLRLATLLPIAYFQTPIELYIKNNEGTLLEYKNDRGQVGCREQAWSAAVALDLASQ